jgi:hypothetical protein
MYTSFPWVYLIKVWTNSRSGKMQWNPKMSSKSNNFCKLDLATSLPIWSFDIFAMRVLQLTTTRLHGNNMEIQWALTFCKILLPLVSRKLQASTIQIISWDFLQIRMKGLQQIFKTMHYGQRRKGLNGQICTMCITMHCHHISSQLLFHLH